MYDSTEILYQTELFPNQIFKNLKALQDCFYYRFFFRNSHSQEFSVKSCSETFSKIHKKTSVQEFLSTLHANKNQLAVRLLLHILNGRKTCSEFFSHQFTSPQK